MSRSFGLYGPTFPRLGALGFHITGPLLTSYCSLRKFYRPESRYAQERGRSMPEKLRSGKLVYLLGIGPGGHNAGVSLVEVSQERGVRIICNNEEERYTGIKYCTDYPARSIETVLAMMRNLRIEPGDIHACLASWNYLTLSSSLLRILLEELPESVKFLHPEAFPALNFKHVWRAYRAPGRLGRQLGLGKALPIIGMRHHCNHAYFSYAVSPFARSEEPVMVTVLDGTGDDGAISLYLADRGRLKLIHSNNSIFDSLGLFYSFISSTQGGWTILSSEGRYMGAAAWGNENRLTNPFYRQLRQLFYFGDDGRVYLNRALANWHRALQLRPYTSALSKILGPPIPVRDLWNPDAVLSVDDIRHSEITQERLDKAAATQLVFEDLLFHIVGHLIRSTGSNKLVLTGGTALNGLAAMRLLEHFDESYYKRHFDQAGKRLHLWIPPTPGDAGAPVGAAYHFALAHGAPLGEPLRHAFYCGNAPGAEDISKAIRANVEMASLPLGNLSEPNSRDRLADLLAYIVSRNGIVGLFQGAAETGPRALGHRSIVANPCNPAIREIINQRVKFRESIRPLAPMMTYEAARRCFELAPGAADDQHNAYNYMVLTARARPEAYSVVPAVIHKDGTSRIQIVREDTDPFTYAYLKAMGRRVGAEVSINTSLNVGSPIVQTPAQALQALSRSKGMDALLMIAAEGDAFLVWHNVPAPPKDQGRRLLAWLKEWQVLVGASVVAPCT